METSSNIIELRFKGNNISPDKVKASEIGLLVINFEKALLNQIKEAEPSINISNEVLFTFERIDNNSLDLFFIPKQVREIVVASYVVIATAFSTGDYTKINKESISALNEIVKFSKRNSCTGSFNLDNEEISSFEPNHEIAIPKSQTITGETTLYGKIIRIGGEEPKVHFRIDENQKLIFDIDENLAKKLSPKIYDFIGLVGIATWNSKDFSIEKFEVSRLLEFDNKPIATTFTEISGLIGKYWDEVEDVENYLN